MSKVSQWTAPHTFAGIAPLTVWPVAGEHPGVTSMLSVHRSILRCLDHPKPMTLPVTKPLSDPPHGKLA